MVTPTQVRVNFNATREERDALFDAIEQGDWRDLDVTPNASNIMRHAINEYFERRGHRAIFELIVQGEYEGRTIHGRYKK